jgi:hypothetical protein
LSGWPITTYLNGNSGNYQTDYRVVHGSSAPVLADLDGDGTMEYVVVGSVSWPWQFNAHTHGALLVSEPGGTRRRVKRLPWEWCFDASGSAAGAGLADLNRDSQLESYCCH